MLGLIMTESIPRQVDRKPGIPEEERRVWGSGILKIGVWNSQGGGKDKHLLSSTFLSLRHLKLFFSL